MRVFPLFPKFPLEIIAYIFTYFFRVLLVGPGAARGRISQESTPLLSRARQGSPSLGDLILKRLAIGEQLAGRNNPSAQPSTLAREVQDAFEPFASPEQRASGRPETAAEPRGETALRTQRRHRIYKSLIDSERALAGPSQHMSSTPAADKLHITIGPGAPTVSSSGSGSGGGGAAAAASASSGSAAGAGAGGQAGQLTAASSEPEQDPSPGPCGVDWLLCCFGLLTLSGCRARISRKLVYFPPSPPLYEVEYAAEDGGLAAALAESAAAAAAAASAASNSRADPGAGERKDSGSSASAAAAGVSSSVSGSGSGGKQAGAPKPGERPAFRAASLFSVVDPVRLTRVSSLAEPFARFVMVPTRLGERIATLWIPFLDSDTPVTTTILYSHGNAADLGGMSHFLTELCQRAKVNVFAYDYSGYGLSTGKASPRNTLADIEAAHEYLRATYPEQSGRVILYGQSLGTAVSVHAAAAKPDAFAGVVLHSGLMSALRCIRDMADSRWYDIYPSVDLVHKITAPLFIIHGDQDLDIPRHHGEALLRRAQCPYRPWFVPHAGHNNVEMLYKSRYFAKVR